MARDLKMFMRGKNVAALQELLSRMGYPIEDQPRQFGASTRDAVKSFQRQQGLSPNGQVDEALLQRMQQGMPPKAKLRPESGTQVNQAQLDALIRLLLQKNIISDAELQAELSRPQSLSVTQKPLV